MKLILIVGLLDPTINLVLMYSCRSKTTQNLAHLFFFFYFGSALPEGDSKVSDK